MKKIAILLLLLAAPCFADGPKYSYRDSPKLDDEIRNIYHDIRINNLGNLQTLQVSTVTLISSITVTNMTVSSLAISTITLVSSMTATGATITSLVVGTINGAAFSSSKLIQTLTNTSTSATSTTSSCGTFADTNLTVTVPITSASSKILLFAMGAIKTNAATRELHATFTRGSTNLGDATSGLGRVEGDAGDTGANLTMVWIDSPATTGNVVYKVQVCSTGGASVTWGFSSIPQILIAQEITVP